MIAFMDHLFPHHFGNRFVRAGVAADGGACCGRLLEYCEWTPERGFEGRE